MEEITGIADKKSRFNDKKFNFWFNMFILVGMITAVLVVNIFKIQAQHAVTVKQIVVTVGAIMGVVNTVLSANGNIWTFLFGVLDVSIGAYANYDSGNMGQFAQHAFYFLPMQFIGWWQWRKRGAGKVSKVKAEVSGSNVETAKVKTEISKVKARRLTGKQWVYVGISIVLGTAICYGILYWVDLRLLETGKIAEIDKAKLFLDAFVLVLNLIGQILMSWAYMDQWYLWNLVNVFSILLWTNRLMSAGSDSYTIVMVIKYSFYLLNSINGLRIWLKLSRPEPESRGGGQIAENQ
ncbi:MAG: nicotinamide mononucleotide transporter [Bacteroidales bacterium]|nr:nicotinamide mononucleotide transporter [Bacteroidales bacterium]MBQ2492615.1 nicotinamide mononucleotide transporter [Bacteroidales bacterium]